MEGGPAVPQACGLGLLSPSRIRVTAPKVSGAVPCPHLGPILLCLFPPSLLVKLLGLSGRCCSQTTPGAWGWGSEKGLPGFACSPPRCFFFSLQPSSFARFLPRLHGSAFVGLQAIEV